MNFREIGIEKFYSRLWDSIDWDSIDWSNIPNRFIQADFQIHALVHDTIRLDFVDEA